MDIATDEVHHFVFRPPFPLDLLDHKDFRSANYIHSVLGVLHWSVGIQSLTELTTSIPAKSVLLCNGTEKVSLFKQLMPHVHAVFNVDISYGTMPSENSCTFPVHHKLCSHSNCMKLNKHFNSYFFVYTSFWGGLGR